MQRKGHAEIVSHGPDETREIGRRLGLGAESGDLLLLVGGLGAGKTCLAQGILWGLDVDEYARSPTFVLVAEYPGRLTLYHVDLYRVETADEIPDLGLDEYIFGGGVCVVEWAERAPDVFPDSNLTIRIEVLDETTRRLRLVAAGERYVSLLRSVEGPRVN